MPEGQRALAVNEHRVLQPDMTETWGSWRRQKDFETKSLSGHLMQYRSKRTNRIYRHSLDWEIRVQSQFVSFYRLERF